MLFLPLNMYSKCSEQELKSHPKRGLTVLRTYLYMLDLLILEQFTRAGFMSILESSLVYHYQQRLCASLVIGVSGNRYPWQQVSLALGVYSNKCPW
jgi:hypothetical protein